MTNPEPPYVFPITVNKTPCQTRPHPLFGDIYKLTLPDVRTALEARGLTLIGTRDELRSRLYRWEYGLGEFDPNRIQETSNIGNHYYSSVPNDTDYEDVNPNQAPTFSAPEAENTGPQSRPFNFSTPGTSNSTTHSSQIPNKMAPDPKIPFFKPQIFSGAPGESFEDWLKYYEHAVKSNHWSEEMRQNYVPQYLEGAAKTKFNILAQKNPESLTWQKFKEEFTNEFERNLEDLLEAALSAIVQKPSQSVLEYILEVETLCGKFKPPLSEKRIIREILKGINEELLHKLIYYPNATLKELRANVDQVLSAQIILQKRGKTPPVTVNAVNSRPEQQSISEIAELRTQIQNLTAEVQNLKCNEFPPESPYEATLYAIQRGKFPYNQSAKQVWANPRNEKEQNRVNPFQTYQNSGSLYAPGYKNNGQIYPSAEFLWQTQPQNLFQNSQNAFQNFQNPFQSPQNAFQNAQNTFQNSQNPCQNSQNAFQNFQNAFQNSQNPFQNSQNAFQNPQNAFQNVQHFPNMTTYPVSQTQTDQKDEKQNSIPECYFCEQKGHTIMRCPLLHCKKCNSQGHVAKYCPDQQQKNL